MDTLLNLSNGFFRHISTNTDIESVKHREMNCLHTALKSFLQTGTKEDAFVVYFCFCEIYKVFGEGYDNTKRLLELLSDHEYHSGELLAKHRDHYSHSVYVFALGLAFFAHNKTFRDTYCRFYGIKEPVGYYEYLLYWGLTSLFHDIGYPFQLAHEQIKSYCSELWGNNKSNPYISYGNFDAFITIEDDELSAISNCGCLPSYIKNINDILAYAVNLRLGYDRKEITPILYSRVIKQPNFMDHGYFSSVLFLKQLLASNLSCLKEQMIDVLSAILLHNSFNKYDAPNSHPIAMIEHPLAYILILCDELQSWDRCAYGKISKRDPIAYDIRLDITEELIHVDYIFDKSTISDCGDGSRKNKSYEEISNGVFAAQIIGGHANDKNFKGYISSDINIVAKAEEKPKGKKATAYFSNSNLVNLYDFAVAIHASYVDLCNESASALNIIFGELPLEFKISNIQLAKSYSKKLALINCFYSDKDLDYPVVDDIEKDENGYIDLNNLETLSRDEHVRWVREKIQLGWKYGVNGVDFTSIEERNYKKLHNCLVPYELLSEDDKNKDREAIKNIIPMLRKMGNNIKVYRLPYETKPSIIVTGIGHRYIKDITSTMRNEIKKILSDLSIKYNVIVSTSYAYGADQIIAECANELRLTTHALLPYSYQDFIEYVRDDAIANGVEYTQEDTMRLRLLLAQTAKCEYIEQESENVFEATSMRSIMKANKLIAVWDGKELPLFDSFAKPVNRGGTYDCIVKAQNKGMKMGEDIFVVKCNRG